MCIASNSLVDLPGGTMSIKALSECSSKSVRVWASEMKRGSDIFSAPAQNIKCTKQGVTFVRVILDDETYLDCTPEQRLLVLDPNDFPLGWKERLTSQLRAGSYVRSMSHIGEAPKHVVIDSSKEPVFRSIVEVRQLEGVGDSYNMEVARVGWFYSNKILLRGG